MEYWYLWLILVLLCIVTVFVLLKASSAAKLHNNDRDKLMKELDRMKALKNEFTGVTREKAETADARTLLDGVTAVLQVKIEKAEDAEDIFGKFSSVQKNIYTLYYFIDDVNSGGLSFFFKNNGEPLISLAVSAFNAVNLPSFSDIIQEEYNMFDENNEEISLDNEKLKEIDSKFLTIYDEAEVLSKIKAYIVENTTDLC